MEHGNVTCSRAEDPLNNLQVELDEREGYRFLVLTSHTCYRKLTLAKDVTSHAKGDGIDQKSIDPC